MAHELRVVSSDAASRPREDTYAFGRLQIDVSRHLVTRDGQPIALAPKTFELLLILVRSGGRVLSRQELIALLWPDTFVEEANLSFQISTLRKALGDGAEQWIETMPKVGYRFTPDVRVLPSGAAPSPGHTPQVGAAWPPVDSVTTPREQSPGRRRVGWRPLLAGALAVVLLVAVVYGALSHGIPSTLVTTATTTSPFGASTSPLTAYHGGEGSPSLSPDGSQVAFYWNGQNRDNFDIYVKVVGGGEPLRLTSHAADDVAPAWSPDGQRLAFVRGVPGTGQPDLMVMPALGGTERRIATVGVAWGFSEPGASLLSWTPDGKWIAIGAEIDKLRGVWLIEVDGPRRRRLTEPPDRHWDASPVVAADGRRVAFIRTSALSRNALFALALEPDGDPVNAPRQVIDPAPLQVIAAVWGPDDASLVYSVGSYMGSSRLRRVALGSDRLAPVGPPEALPFGDQATGLDVAQSGRLVYASRFRDSGLWQLDLTRPTRGLRETALLDTRFDEHTPHYSPDGTRLAFASTRTGTEEIWIANADGSDPRQMTSMGGTMCANPQWSPDGQQIVFSSAKAGSLDLYLLDPSTAELRQLTSAPGWEDLPRWSRDGTWIYFSARAPGQEMAEIWKMPAAGGSPQQVTTGGGDVASESHDGSVLFFARSSARLAALWRMPLKGGRPTLMADGLVGTLNFAVGRRAVYFVSSAGRPGDSTIDEIDIASGKRITLAGFGRRWWGVALSPDERTLIVSAINDQGLDLMLVEPAR